MGSDWPPTHSSGSAGIAVYSHTWLNVASFRNNFPIESCSVVNNNLIGEAILPPWLLLIKIKMWGNVILGLWVTLGFVR